MSSVSDGRSATAGADHAVAAAGPIGEHYTTEKNTLTAIRPLFLYDSRSSDSSARGSARSACSIRRAARAARILTDAMGFWHTGYWTTTSRRDSVFGSASTTIVYLRPLRRVFFFCSRAR